MSKITNAVPGKWGGGDGGLLPSDTAIGRDRLAVVWDSNEVGTVILFLS
jgi:hypothetical protein